MKKYLSLLTLFLCAISGFAQQPQPADGNNNGHEYVDLGLSVKWATMNIGASMPDDYGDYFAWGETTPKKDYTERTYKWWSRRDYTMTKYNNIDNKTTLDISDDAAHANWGGSWRMPTYEEMDELRKNCEWHVTYHRDGIAIFTATGPNGNSIYFPGYHEGTGHGHALCWSSSRLESYIDEGYILQVGYDYLQNIHRTGGLPIRAVCP